MKKFIIIVIAVVVICVALAILYFSFPQKGYDTSVEIIEISSPNYPSKLFIKKKTWGMTGDGQVVVISSDGNKKFEPDSTQDYIFDGLSPLFYKVETDTLTLYTYQSSTVPSTLKSNFVVRQIELENPAMMKLIENDSYKQQGLKLVK